MKKITLYSVFLTLFFPSVLFGQTFNQKENAVYIYNFIKNTEFPVKKATIIIGVFGTTGVEAELKTLLSNKSANYIIKKITIENVKAVDVIIVAKSSTKNLKAINTATAKLPILIITEQEDQNYAGSCISLFMDEDDDFKTKYQLSPFNLRTRGLTLSSTLINNAILVR